MRKNNVSIGIFIVSGFALFSLVLFTIGNRHKAFSPHVDLYTEFANITGLTKGADVQVAGFDAGEIADIQVPNSPSGRFRLKLRIDQRLNLLVRTDSLVTIDSEGIVGDKFVQIHGGSANASEATSLAMLPSKEPLSLADLLESSSDLINGANGTMKGVQGKLDGTLDAATKTIDNANDLIVGIKQGKGTVGMLLRDQTTATEVQQAVANGQQATVSLKHASGQADALVSDFESRGLGGKVDQTMLSVRSAAGNLDSTSAQLHQIVTEAVGDDGRGVDAGGNLEQSLSNLTQVTGNMAADTEALKHEFFFRGFFKHRGYYSLTDLDPATYRSDRLFANPDNPRAWVQAAKLFEQTRDGQERLSAEGKLQIEEAVAELGDQAINGPLVIEGYSSQGDGGTQLAASHSRALLVLNYIHSRYRIDLRNVGAVALRSVPPPAVHKETWDGVCIMALKASSG
ncbi:MAG: MlaD family protein [Candidatus Sulfotelmatobacter sp.]